MTEGQNKLLYLMLDDMQEQSSLYTPTAFWAEASKIIINDIEEKGIEDFRSHPSSYSMFAPIYSYPDYITNPTVFDAVKATLSNATNDLKSNLKLKMLMAGEIQAFSDYRVLKASNKHCAPYTDKVSESSLGSPVEHYTFDGRNFSRSFLNYLLGLNFIKQHADTSNIKTVMEIGGGFGTLGEILLSDERNDCFYINADIPPVSFVSSYYLKELFGSEKIADYGDLRDSEILDIDTLQKQYKAINISSWQVPKLKGEIDLFVNFISFQEMEPEVVQNYCNYITGLKPQYILLRNIEEGKKKKDENTIYGVESPIIGGDYDNFLPQYELLATDGSIFGFKTEDNFHSQLRLYVRKEGK